MPAEPLEDGTEDVHSRAAPAQRSERDVIGAEAVAREALELAGVRHQGRVAVPENVEEPLPFRHGEERAFPATRGRRREHTATSTPQRGRVPASLGEDAL